MESPGDGLTRCSGKSRQSFKTNKQGPASKAAGVGDFLPGLEWHQLVFGVPWCEVRVGGEESMRQLLTDLRPAREERQPACPRRLRKKEKRRGHLSLSLQGPHTRLSLTVHVGF
ncbi:hypothetical protein GHT09_015534 [Marmota monax]|uniref:Uncharacterized protein n=1 Tax=Marmota monax TaxID=9995 RepID=A0A834PWU4_MARMO|nr:hypothetical protein GHT09_015534 [Marmota monax]